MPYNDIISRTDADALISEEYRDQIIQGALTSSTVMQLGNRVSNFSKAQARVPVLDTLPLAYFVNPSDTGLKQTTELTWANTYFNVEEIAVVVPMPEAVVDDADFDIIGQAMPRISEAFGTVFDNAVLHGTNAPASWPTDITAGAVAAGNNLSLATQEALPEDIYDTIMGTGGLLSQVEADGYMVNGHVAAISQKAKLRSLRATDGVPIFNSTVQGATQYQLDGAPVYFPRNGFDAASTLQIAGDWSQLYWGVRQDMTFRVFTEGVVTDNLGAIVYNLMQQDMIALRAVMRIAWALPNPTNLVNGTAATRYPFAVLTP